ncbi:MAG: hypothetical protein O2816_18540, partial [Planctomycetota bacterium]|nr:hypothetical protein [Planctomycetota bacterium]
ERIARGRADQALALAPPEESSEVVRDAWLRMRFEALVAANHLPPEVERRALLEVEANMAAAERVLPEVLAQRVLRLSAEDKPVEALAALDALEAATPTNTNFAALRAVLFAQLDSTGILALNELRRLRETFPTSGRLAALYAQRLEQFEDPVGALRHWVHALTLAGDDQDVQQQALSAMASAGGAPLKVALGMLDLWLLEDPDLRRPRELLEMVLRQAGMDRELNLLLEEEYARAAPDDLAPNAALANFHIARGSFERAREVLRERVAADPGAHSARATLSRLGEPHPAERFFHAFGPDRQEAIDAARGPQDSSIAEALDSGLVYLYPDGSSHERYHTISMALDRKGTELLHTEPVAEHARLAQVLKQDGRILEPSEVNREWVMPFLEPGDAVELVWDQFTRGRRGSAPQIGWWRFASFEKPFVRSRYVLYVPDGLQGELRPFQFDGEYEAFRFDGGTVHVFLVKDRPRQEQEPMLPSFEEILPWVQYGGDLPIDYIEASWRDRLHVLAHVPADLRTELTEVARSVSGTDLDRAKALFDAVTAHVLDFRGAAHAAQVWPSKRGNPIFLLGALYELAGIEFEWAVLEEAIAPELNPQPKQAFEDLRGYQVPALRVKGDPPVWVLAPSGRGETFASIPDDMAGAPVLVLAEDGARVEPLPRQQLDDSWDLDLSVAYDVAANGDASVSGTIRITAANGAVMREELSQVSAVQRGGAARQIAGQVVPGLNLAGFDFPDLGTRGAPFMMTFTGSVPQFAREQAGRFRAGLPIRPTGLATGLGAADRRWPLALRFSQRQRLEVTVRGEGWRVTDGPRPFEEQRDGFVHTLETGDDAGGWRALRIFIIRGPVLAPDEVAGFLTREAELERETTRALELERTD